MDEIDYGSEDVVRARAEAYKLIREWLSEDNRGDSDDEDDLNSQSEA